MWLTVGIAAVSALVAFGTGWEVRSMRCIAAETARLSKVKIVTEAKQDKVLKASTKVEVQKEKVRIKYVQVVKEVEKIVDRPVYKNVCLDDDGLKAINEGMLP